MKRLKFVGTLGIMMIGISVFAPISKATANPPAAVGAVPTGPFGLYRDKEQFKAAMKAHRPANAPAKENLTQAEKRRFEEIEKAFNKLRPEDVVGKDALAKKYGLMIYSTGGKRGLDYPGHGGGVQIDSVETDVYMYDPEIYYDSVSYQVGIRGEAYWLNMSEALMDEANGRGGPDAYTTLIQNIPSKTNVKRQSLYTYTQAGTLMKSGTTLWSTPLQNATWPVTLRWQDDGYYDTSFNSYDIITWVWTYGLSSPVVVGNQYEHNWRSTQLDSISFATKAGASKSVSLEFGATWNWSIGTDSWVGESNFIQF